VQMRDAWIAGYDPGPLELDDLAPLLGRLDREGTLLEPLELLALARLLALSTRVRRLLHGSSVEERYPEVHRLAGRLADFGPLVRRLEEVFDPSGDFLDTASPRLARIRKRLNDARGRTREALDHLAREGTAHPEESFVTLRDGRYVLAVRTQDRAALPGIVHGRSKSGQTVFLEPMDAVERNNAISSLVADEQEERLAILRELTGSVRERSDEVHESHEAATELDLLRARASLGLDLEATVPTFHPDGGLRLVAARHPLLAEVARKGGAAVVPLDLEMGAEARTLVVSGPNMGGKTVALKTVGLFCAMAQSGLLVPAREGTQLPFVDAVFVDLGDEQSIEEETSTFAGHLRNIAEAWEGATGRSLVLLDELGGGTDPEEGTALGRALIELLTERRCLLLVTTHLIGLKMVAQEDRRMRNGAMEYDAETQRPSFRLRIGAPGRSRAFELARQIFPPGELTERAERYRSRWTAHLDELLGDLERQRHELAGEIERMQTARQGLEESTRRKERQADRLRGRLQTLREVRWEAEGRTLREAARLLEEARRVRREAGSREHDREGERAAEQELERAVRSTQGRRARPRDRRAERLETGRIRPGVPAFSHDLKGVVRVEGEPDATGKVWISHGAFRLQVPADSLGPIPEGLPAPRRRPPAGPIRGAPDPPPAEREIDLRGRTAEEGRTEAERFIDRCAVAGLAEVRIIHGKGTGALKR
ncbi:MAG: hypothetical protein GF328_06380, partial [Candidatus Latescibacteria bacterium]|nr:hypothetical protein [Candidatus Latescibacterota bacterium]